MRTTRCAIIGTAQSWNKTPWSDPDLYIVGLNDAYVLGFPRVDEWWDLHPLDKLHFRKKSQKIIRTEDVPPGYYVRPEGHVEWLRKQSATIPVYLQQEPLAGWGPHAQRFPVEDIEARYGSYWASGPAYEVMSLYDRGFREFQIYGIHLSTDHERIEQRHNFEFLLGRLLGPHVTQTTEKGLRTYRGGDVTIVLPSESPILQHGWRYAYDVKPPTPVDPFAEEWRAVQQEKADLVKAMLKGTPPMDPLRVRARWDRLTVIEVDIRQELGRRHQGGTLTAQLAG